MFIWPDSLPPGSEWLILATVPLGVVRPDGYPTFAAIQVGLIFAAILVAVTAVRRLAIARGWLWLIVPGVYLIVVFSTNVALAATLA